LRTEYDRADPLGDGMRRSHGTILRHARHIYQPFPWRYAVDGLPRYHT
jgi:hypothetical protein